jgi:hypothetical protein
MSEYTCHSGGADGADMCWETEGNKYGVKTISYSYKGHQQEGEHPYIMNADELLEGWGNIQKAAETLKRSLGQIEFNPYVRNLLCRNWFQVKNSDQIFAIGLLNKNHKTVGGGTGWAVQMALDNNKEVYVYDQITKSWYKFLYTENTFVEYYDIPTLTQNFAGIGTRKISNYGTNAIIQIYKHNFRK